VVEDEALIPMLVAEYLRECGYQVFEAARVAEAVLGADTPVDLVFTDVNPASEEHGFISGIANAADGNLCESGPLLAKPYTPNVVRQWI
jgi:hypothetical protein